MQTGSRGAGSAVEDQPAEDAWLSIHEASALLGITPSTLRRWADEGQVSMTRTLGGHRRFARDEIRILARGRVRAATSRPAERRPPRWGVDRGELARQDWYARLGNGPAAGQMRGLGQRLLGLLLQYLGGREEKGRLLNEARLVASSYGRRARRARLSMHETLKACLFFRKAFAQLEAPLPGLATPLGTAELRALYSRLNEFMDTVLLGLVSGYEAHPE
jgi:excisionase family DNA binding protein